LKHDALESSLHSRAGVVAKLLNVVPNHALIRDSGASGATISTPLLSAPDTIEGDG